MHRLVHAASFIALLTLGACAGSSGDTTGGSTGDAASSAGASTSATSGSAGGSTGAARCAAGAETTCSWGDPCTCIEGTYWRCGGAGAQARCEDHAGSTYCSCTDGSASTSSTSTTSTSTSTSTSTTTTTTTTSTGGTTGCTYVPAQSGGSWGSYTPGCTSSCADYRCYDKDPRGVVGQWCCCASNGSCNTPLVLSFDGAPVTYPAASGQFELVRPGSGLSTDWPAARTPWLVLDVNGNGRIDDGRELFGSMTVLPDGRLAANGFEALAALDANHDGVLDARDPGFARLRLWSDVNRDRHSSPGELRTLAQEGVVSLQLGYTVERRCDAGGNCEVERASFAWRDAQGQQRRGALVDVHLAARPR